jgi:hypothetical protein
LSFARKEDSVASPERWCPFLSGYMTFQIDLTVGFSLLQICFLLFLSLFNDFMQCSDYIMCNEWLNKLGRL